jgi:hypothetical protein
MIETLFLPPEGEEQIVAALLGDLPTMEAEPPNNTNSEDKGERGRRRKSFLDGMGEKTLYRRYGELDALVEAEKGLFFFFLAVAVVVVVVVVFFFFFFFYIDSDPGLLQAWHQSRMSDSNKTILSMGMLLFSFSFTF